MVREKAFDVSGLNKQLAEHPEVWDAITLRKDHPRSPHREISDVWVRYNPIENYHGDMAAFNSRHVGQWYPVAEVLTEAKRLAVSVMQDVGAEELGAVLITKIPPGKQVYPHVDGGWHASYYEKFAVQVQGNDRQAFHFKDEELITRDGDLFWFENAFPHWVTNESDMDRITLIICTKDRRAGG